jgi:hypothetical protein
MHLGGGLEGQRRVYQRCLYPTKADDDWLGRCAQSRGRCAAQPLGVQCRGTPQKNRVRASAEANVRILAHHKEIGDLIAKGVKTN